MNSPDGFHGTLTNFPLARDISSLTITDIYGNSKNVKKSKSYMIHGVTNLIGITDKTQYARNKKIFQQGFSDSAIREHEPKVIREVNTFIEKMSENETTEREPNGWTNPKNMALWCMTFLYFRPWVVESNEFTDCIRQLAYHRCD